jgi:hypothetical protein
MQADLGLKEPSGQPQRETHLLAFAFEHPECSDEARGPISLSRLGESPG